MLEVSMNDFIKSRRTKEVLNWALASLFISKLVEGLIHFSKAADVKKKIGSFLGKLPPSSNAHLWRFIMKV